MTEIKKIGWVFYDATCGFCSAQVERWRPFLMSCGFEPEPLGGEVARQLPPEEVAVDEMKVMTRDGMVYGGADAIAYLLRQSRYGGLARWIFAIPGFMMLMSCCYRIIARNRHCRDGKCVNPGRGGLSQSRLSLFLLPLLPLAMIAATWNAQGWVMMWLVAVAIYACCKWLTLRSQPRGCPFRAVGYLFFWPGMDAAAFMRENAVVPFPRRREWGEAVAKLLAGVALIWGGVRFCEGDWVQGWVGMVGMVSCLHFGVFHLLSLMWRTVGVDAQPLMRAPLRSQTIGEFWGVRWNRGFHDLAQHYFFTPLRARWGARSALLLTFALSGLVHELVITLPARGGYGLPLAYFVLQALGMLVQRSSYGRRHFTGGWRGRLFTLLLVAVPAPLLFPPVFIDHVIHPFLHTISAL